MIAMYVAYLISRDNYANDIDRRGQNLSMHHTRPRQ